MSTSVSLAADKAKTSVRGSSQPSSGTAKPWQSVSKPAGFGLPCAMCRTYYPADLSACPICRSPERVSASGSAVLPKGAAVESCPDPAVLEEERERFLREFKAQLLASQTSLPASGKVCCTRAENHLSDSQPAAVCQSCYDHLQDRVDVLEAALHIDIKEAAQIVYDAVWADTSESSQSYENAATALLTELRKRSGVTPTFGLMKPVTD